MSNIKNPQSNPLKSSAPVRPPGGDTTPKEVYDITSVDPMNYNKKTTKLHCRLERRQK